MPGFTSLQEFEWIGYPEMSGDMVNILYANHPYLHALGHIGWHFDAVGISKFRNLRKFTLRAEDDDGIADMGEVRTVLDNNEHTLTHLTFGAWLMRDHSWDGAFQSVTIRNLTHLDLVDTRISPVVLARIAHAHNLRSLTLHGTFEEPAAASVVFGSDDIFDGKHTFLPHLESFRFITVGHDDDLGLFQSVTQFLKGRTKMRRLDLGNCPWELVLGVLPELKNLQVLRVRIANLIQSALKALVKSLPRQMTAIHLAVTVSDKPIVSVIPVLMSAISHKYIFSTSTHPASIYFLASRSFISIGTCNPGQNHTFPRRTTKFKANFGTRAHGVLLSHCLLSTLWDGTVNITLS